jgi:transposase
MSKTKTIVEYQTIQVGTALLAHALLKELRVAGAIDAAVNYQPKVNATYGHLLQAVILNRLTFAPQPLYCLSEWAARHGIDDLLGIDAAWLDDDRLGAGLEAVADHQVEIWVAILKRARERFALPMEQSHGDTTSIYFEGDFVDDQGRPLESRQARVPNLRIGYNKDGQRDKKQMVLSLINVGRVPIWYSPWDGNRSDDGLCWNDLKELRQHLLLPENHLLIGDRKLCSQETMIELCRQQERFLAPHPWTPMAKKTWRETYAKLSLGELRWQEFAYLSQNDARKPPDKRPRHRVCEVTYTLYDKQRKTSYKLRWLFVHSSHLAESSARQREKALTTGQAALERIASLLGKYQYQTRAFIARRIEEELRRARATGHFRYTLTGTDGKRDWRLSWERDETAIALAQSFDGVMLLCTNTPADELTPDEAFRKHKEQIGVEQTIDFIKSPIQIRPTWLHLPKRIAGLSLLVMIAVLVAMLLEFEVRRLLKEQNKQIKGLRPEGRKDPLPTAKSLLRAFSDYTLVVVRHADGAQEIHYPKFRPVPQQIWDLLNLPPLPG